MATLEELLAEQERRKQGARKAELLAEAQKRGIIPAQPSPVADQLQKREDVQVETPDLDQPGILDYLTHAGETAATMISGAVAEPVAGIAGLVKTITSGPEEGTQTIEQMREAMQYQPRGKMTQEAFKNLMGKFGPTIESIVKGYEEHVATPAFEAGGPVAGTLAMTAPAAIAEIVGLKGSRAAKKMALKKAMPQIDVSTAYDELGNLLPEIKQSVQKSGITMEEISDVLPERIPETAVKETAAEVGKVAGQKFGQKQGLESLAEKVKPSKEILDAAEEFGLSDQMLASHTSGNPLYIAIEQGLKSVPGSQLAAQEKALITNLSKKADDLITEFGGEIDKSALSDRFKTQSKNVIDDLTDEAEKLYKEVDLSIPRNTPVEANTIIRKIRETADELGGEEFLDTAEKGLLNALSPEANPTYARLDKFRKQIGQSLHKKSGPFKDADEGALKQLYAALAEDQKAVADIHGVGDLYDSAKGLIVQRKGLEKQLVQILGKDLTGTISAKAKPAMLGLQKGDTKQFDQLANNIPEQLGKGERRAIFATALNDAFTQGSRAERSLSVPAFDDFMTGLNRNKSSKQRLTDEIGKESMRRLESFHKIIGGIRRAQRQEITTGRVTAVPGMLDEVDSIASRLYGTGKKIAAAEGLSTVAGAPGIGTTGVLAATFAAKRTPRSVAADQLLSSGKFQRLVNRKAAGTLDTTAKIEKAEKEIQKLKAYKKWESSLDDKDLKDLAAVGIVGYLTGASQQQGVENGE